MRIYPFQLCWIIIFVWTKVLLGSLSGSKAPDQPNILFIFSDDHSFYDVGFYGNKEVHTPNIDALARAGVVFSHAYNMGSWSPAVCMPSRTMLQSGLFLWNARNYDKNKWFEQGLYWPQILRQAGYRTYMTGKWHVHDVQVDAIFDVVLNERPGMPNDTEEVYQRPAFRELEDPWSPYRPEFGGFWEGGKHWSEVLVEDFEVMLDEAVERKEPFFMFLSFNAPHDPRQSPKEFLSKYPVDSIRIPDNYLPEYPFNEAIGSGRELRDERTAPFPRTPFATRVQRREYYAIITHMDYQIGRIIRALEASGVSENTWIIYSSDHGLAVGQHGLMGKQNMYDHSLRVPFIITGPGIDSHQVLNTPIYLQDVMPTVLEIAGAEINDGIQFQSVLPLIRGDRETSYPAIYGAYLENLQRAVIQDDFKLILYPQAGIKRLFNLAKDPYEMNDLYGLTEYGDTVTQLLEKLQSLQRKVGDPLDLTEYFNPVSSASEPE